MTCVPPGWAPEGCLLSSLALPPLVLAPCAAVEKQMSLGDRKVLNKKWQLEANVAGSCVGQNIV